MASRKGGSSKSAVRGGSKGGGRSAAKGGPKKGGSKKGGASGGGTRYADKKTTKGSGPKDPGTVIAYRRAGGGPKGGRKR